MKYAEKLLDQLEPHQLKWLTEALHHKIVGGEGECKKMG
jgi:hypothetical protein